ncbi:MAG TPA: STAS domain-containing protein [Bryobacteraceae bacterium]|nr:STAS domain-containing protein [Bryobacteraceae bacterium]
MITETKTRQADPDITIFEIAGRLNLGNSLMAVENTIRRLIEDGTRKLVIDLASLTAIDSSGIGLLVTTAGQMEQHGGKLRVAGARDGVAKALELVHLNRIVPLDYSVESACQELAADAAGA